ncbi:MULTISPECIES: ABC transporter substrate-binding protein [Pseudomonas]|uniref:Transporter substrate-binding domain-containing protein n=1 Tax=Pseudomonas citronellolis TaxID=53408 RepID=A0AAW6P642_9PSED|nr:MULTISPECIES: transporter substrate-binding domain-containing protein [Pseudomonas]AMO76870.1 L-cystine-binding protein TcyA precursor [Pseudomonas citronellolis]KES22345.1 amino acid ABC transporter substrate-binding protein [Pseudomonas sp. AAC]KRV65829.1 amino acid ABC transporter substrate-binding protein [Pseudomonas citronellolis]KRW76252.1 amino acid ABC transporter substrate-binding protein [Pseudomonas citronellolis]MBH3435182.1 transporter substrate-binding domain-containing prote
MARMFPRSIRKALACAAAVGALLTQTPSQAADTSMWQGVQKAGVLRCGAAVAAPYVMRDASSGQYSGYFVDLCRDFGEKVLKVKVEFVDTNWDNLVAGLQSGKWDLAMALNQTPERALAVAFSAPATDYQVSLVVNKENPKFSGAGNAIADYDKPGVTFAVMSGTAQDKAISSVLKQGTVMRLPGMDETRLALMSRRADVLVDASDTNHLFAMANDWAREVLPKPALAKQGVAFGMRRDISAADLQVLNIYVTQRRETGEIDRLVDKASAEVNAKTAAK